MSDTDVYVDPAGDDQMLDEEWDDEPLMWHGCLAPEGVESGDGRTFAPESLTWRDLPLPLRWQKADIGAHAGAVIVGTIARIERRGDRIMGEGTFSDIPEADEAVGLIGEGALKGVSIDADDAEMSAGLEDDEGVEFTRGRICAATLVAVPAFQEAYIALGPLPDEETGEEAIITSDTTLSDDTIITAAEAEWLAEARESFVSEEPWDGSASRFTPEQWKSSCCLHLSDEVEPKSNHKLPIKEPGGALSRAGTHAAAARINQTDAPPAAKSAAKSKLRGAYAELKEEAPDAVKADDAAVEDFARGPGWVTNPIATRRIHAYWTKPGHEGFNKVRWGTPGDFTRLRRFLSKYIPATLLNRVTAQWHHDALGYWPGEAGRPGNPPVGAKRKRSVMRNASESVHLVAAALEPVSARLFDDPKLDGPTAIIVDGDHVYGHICEWDLCHLGIKDVCTTPPHSTSSYAFFRTGAVITDEGRISVGQLTVGTGHAGLSANARATAAHYDHSGTVVADVACGEDEFGIWVAGKIRDDATQEQIHALQAGAISGDWRAVGGELELIAALVVNVPGFPVTRPSLAASGGEQTSLVAAGIILHDPLPPDLPSLVSAVADEMARRETAAARVRAVRAAINSDRVAALQAAMA